MAFDTFVLTSSPFLLSQVTLASFVPNILQPHQDAKRPYEVNSSDYSVQADQDFDGLINTSSKTLFNILATKLFWFSVGRDKESTLCLTARRGNIYSLNSPSDIFDHIMSSNETGEKMQMWLEGCKRRKREPRFIVGYRTFIDARVDCDKRSSAQTSGKASAPISSFQGDPTGAADLEFQASWQAGEEVKGNMKSIGERIYAICYRKIKISVKKDQITPELGETNKWRSFASMRGDDYEAEFIQAELGDNDDGDLDGKQTIGGLSFVFSSSTV